jgi:replicative DNA helicase
MGKSAFIEELDERSSKPNNPSKVFMSNTLVFIDDTPALNPLEVRAKARRLKKRVRLRSDHH